jgi:ubiquinol-cytochrome c reductase cytochrome c1 subunit
MSCITKLARAIPSIAIATVLGLTPLIGNSAGGPNVALQKANVNPNNQAAIQRGAKYFVNYCMGCHSAGYVRYQILENSGLSAAQIKDNLIFDNSKVSSLMKTALPTQDAETWFGGPAPDLTLTARIRGGEDWIYTYLKGFYTDPNRPMGVNNTLYKNVGMPNVLWELEGIKEPVYRYNVKYDGHLDKQFTDEAEAKQYMLQKGSDYMLEKAVDHMVLTKPGKLSEAEFDQVAHDLAAYLTYIAEPMKQERQRMGWWVILFLSLFTVLAYFMKKEWWKDIH